MEGTRCLIFHFSMILMMHWASAHWSNAYMSSPSDPFTDKSKWMLELPGVIRLNQMAIPGTHLSYGIKGTHYVYNQCLTIKEQLQYGVRFFDINVVHRDNYFEMIGLREINLGGFGDFLKQVQNFLASNPSETVLFRLSLDSNRVGNTRSKLETLDEYLKDYDRYSHITNDQVTLGEARGKYILFSNDNELQKRGINWNIVNSQESDYLYTNWDLYDKWEKVKKQLKNAVNGNSKTFYANFLSGHGTVVFPYFVASGHSSIGTGSDRLTTAVSSWLTSKYPDFPKFWSFYSFEGTNVLTKDFIDDVNHERTYKRSVGVILADFPGDQLIETAIYNNFVFQETKYQPPP